MRRATPGAAIGRPAFRDGSSEMLDIGWSELAVIAVVALLVIGPKDLPRALYTVGKWMRAARKVTRDFQKHVDDMMREAELAEARKGLQQARTLNVRQRSAEGRIGKEGVSTCR